MVKYVFILSLFCCSIVTTQAQENIRLRFKNASFKIAQFTDLHWYPKSDKCAQTADVIRHVLKTEVPDLAILTGDIVVDHPAEEGWLAIARIFAEARIPWTVVMGNHDAEQGITREEIFDILENLPYFIGEKGPSDIFGCGNYSLPVQGSETQTPAAVLYCIDSNDYPHDLRLGYYDWIHFDQIVWYRNLSNSYTQANHNKPLPALAFFHIPLPEYRNITERQTTLGTKRRRGPGGPSSQINSGMLLSMLDQQDVMGTFVGHEHNNDFIGMEHGVALAYGRVTGIDAEGSLERGARIIQMYENEHRFDTWIRTRKGTEFKYYYPSGISLQDEETMPYMPAREIKVKQQGVQYAYYEGRMKSTDEIDTAKPVKTGIVDNFTLAPAAAKDSFAFEFKTWIKLPEKGVYRFYTFSDDGSRLYINGKLIVDNDGSHSHRRIEEKVALDAGFHELTVRYFEDYMGEMLEVGIIGRSIPETIIPGHMLFIAR